MRRLLKHLDNERGMAIIMILSAIALITPTVMYFSIDSVTNKIKVANIEERAKAKLTAESGLKFAMARLKLYKEAYNFLQKNKAAKDAVPQEKLDIIWNFPFIYPIPISSNLNLLQKETINKFHEENYLEGSFNLNINNISNKINLNLLRISLMSEANKTEAEKEEEANNRSEEDEEFNPESQLFKALTNAIETESEKDTEFNSKYFGMEVLPLIGELKYYISDRDTIIDNQGADRSFSEIELSPKTAPIASFSELYTLPSWSDEITNLIINEFTVHGAIMIDLNKITDKLFRLLIPEVEDRDVEEFFKYKDDPEDPKYFNSLDDFKKYIITIGNLMSESDFDDRFKKFQAQGLKFGQSPTLFKVVSSATVGRATYTLTAYVTIPAKPEPRPKNPEVLEEENQKEGDQKPQEPKANEPEKEKIIELLEPRIVEITIS